MFLQQVWATHPAFPSQPYEVSLLALPLVTISFTPERQSQYTNMAFNRNMATQSIQLAVSIASLFIETDTPPKGPGLDEVDAQEECAGGILLIRGETYTTRSLEQREEHAS